MKRHLPIGISDFKEVIEENYYYFDKTGFIEDLFNERSKIKLFTRPRRFGKTLNISMLKYFFDVRNKDENRKLFENLKISKSKYFNLQGEYPVISVTFKDYRKTDWKGGAEYIRSLISNIYDEFYEILYPKLNPKNKQFFEKIWLEKPNTTDTDIENSLLELSKFLYKEYGKKVILLIDEYDQPIISSYINGYYDEAMNFFRAFYGAILKDNSYLETGIMTGILRVAKENVFSGLNNLKIHTIIDNRFTEHFGIMENEIKAALKDFKLEVELEDIQKWYNGYLFGNIKVYNPWSIINFLDEGKLNPYWVNTSGNDLIKLYLARLKNEIFDDFSKLLNKESIFKRIDDNMTFANLETNYSQNIWNLFFHSGYLTLAEPKDYDEMTYLKIPNDEILKMFSQMFIEVYFENYDVFLNMTYALKTGNIQIFEKELKNILLENVGIFDVSGTYKEQFYHGLMLGIILILKNEYQIISNGFGGKGRYDLLLKPKNIQKRNDGIILELKVLNLEGNFNEYEIQEKLDKECENALNQIEEKKYVLALKNAEIHNVIKIGIAFLGKDLKVKFEREYIK